MCFKNSYRVGVFFEKGRFEPSGKRDKRELHREIFKKLRSIPRTGLPRHLLYPV